MFSLISPNILRALGLIGSIASGLFICISTGDIVTGAGIIAAGLSTAGFKRAD